MALVATQCAVLLRTGRTGTFTALAAFWGLGPFTAVAVTTSIGHQWIWARSASVIFWSDGGGATAHSQTIPSQAADSTGVQQTLETNDVKSEAFGFAAYGSRVAVVERAKIAGAPSPRIASVEFDALVGTWELDTVNVGAGVGLGGRLFIKTDTASALS